MPAQRVPAKTKHHAGRVSEIGALGDRPTRTTTEAIRQLTTISDVDSETAVMTAVAIMTPVAFGGAEKREDGGFPRAPASSAPRLPQRLCLARWARGRRSLHQFPKVAWQTRYRHVVGAR